MKRLHIHVGVDDMESSIAFYRNLFGAEPTKQHADYAQWLLAKPQVNFAISTKPAHSGINHLGLQVDSDEELVQLQSQLNQAEIEQINQAQVECCYARSDKSWIRDPAGLPWEIYRTMEDAVVYQDRHSVSATECCDPETRGTPGCCQPSEETLGCCE